MTVNRRVLKYTFKIKGFLSKIKLGSILSNKNNVNFVDTGLNFEKMLL